MNLKTAGIAGLLVLSTACSSVKTYRVSNYIPSGREVNIHTEVDTAHLMEQTLDTIVASGLLDDIYIKTFNQRDFVLELANSQKWSGEYDPLTDDITHKLTHKNFKDFAPGNLLYYSLNTSFHENAHHYWQHNLSEEQQSNFRNTILEKKRTILATTKRDRKYTRLSNI